MPDDLNATEPYRQNRSRDMGSSSGKARAVSMSTKGSFQLALLKCRSMDRGQGKA